MKLTGENRRTRGKTCPSATLSTTNPTWTDPGSNPALSGGRPAANRLSHGTAFYRPLLRGMQLTCTAWVESLNTWDDGRRKTYKACQQHQSLSLHDILRSGHHSLGV
jgi:hypothetical protein